MQSLRFSEYCANCRKSLHSSQDDSGEFKILFVEKELGRGFCCEDCINEYFQPTVQFLEEDHLKKRSESDIPLERFSQFSHYRPLTLDSPDEVWIDQNESGDRYFTFISHFRDGERRLSYVVVCLALEGVPSYVFLNFPTIDEDLVEEYRCGTEIKNKEPSTVLDQLDQLDQPERDLASSSEVISIQEEQEASPVSSYCEIERLYDELRQPGDVPKGEFHKYEPYIELCLDEPDEIWRLIDDQGNEWMTFISSHKQDSLNNFCMVVICEVAISEETLKKGLEVVFAFPTTDLSLVQHFRKGISSLNKSFGVGWARGRAA